MSFAILMRVLLKKWYICHLYEFINKKRHYYE